LFFYGQLVSVTGTWMQYLAQSWLVLKLTHNSGVQLGIVTALQFVPTLLFGMWGGVFADRFDKRKLLVITQSSSGILAIALAALTATHVVQLWMVDALAFALGCATMVDTPTRQAFVTELVGPEQIPNAVALNSAGFNVGRIIGPMLGALVIKLAGLGTAFLLNGVSYFAVVGALIAMDAAALFPQGLVPRARGQVREGLRYVWGRPVLRNTIAVVAVVSTFAFNFTVVLPLLSTLTFHGGAGTLGVLTTVMSVGSLTGALGTAARKRPTAVFLVAATCAFGSLALAVAYAPTLALEAIVLVPMGAASMAFIATANSLLQIRSAGIMRGRVMALYSLVFLGSTAFGGPLTGWIGQVFGARMSLAYGAAATIVAGAVGAAGLARVRRRTVEAATEVARIDEQDAVSQLAV
jgi:MFS family permease